MKLRFLGLGALATLAFAFTADDAAAQYPPQPAPYPQQPYPAQPYPQQPYPQQQQPYPAQPYPQQPYPAQPYPAQPYPAQPGYQPYPQQPYPAQPAQPGVVGPVNPLAAPTNTMKRATGEMVGLYVTSAIYGIGTGIWIDALGKVSDPGAAVILPILFGAGAPVGVYFWDKGIGEFPRGVAASTAAGVLLGGAEGLAISATQWQYTHADNNDWNFRTQTTLTWLLATGGGVGGFAFGEWLKPDPRSSTFIGSGAAWGTLSAGMFGIAVQGRHDDWKDGASIAGIIGYNLGIAGAGAITAFHTPSFQSQKWMWLGYLGGAAAGCLVFPFYIGSDSSAKHGFIGPALGGLAGTAVAGALTWNMQDAGFNPVAWKPPVDIAFAPIPSLTPASTTSTSASSRSLSNLVGPDPRWSTAPPGGMLNASGTF